MIRYPKDFHCGSHNQLRFKILTRYLERRHSRNIMKMRGIKSFRLEECEEVE